MCGAGLPGIEIDDELNAVNAPLISSAKTRVNVRVIHTDEELVIARHMNRLLKLQAAKT